MPIITNGTADTTATDALAAGHNYDAVVIQALANNIIVNIDANAAVGAGETVFANTSATFTNLKGRRVSVYAASATSYSIREEIA